MPPALPSGSPEPMKESIGNVRKALDALKAAVGRKNPLETPQKRHDRIKTSVEPLAVVTQAFRDAREQYRKNNQGFENTPEYQKLVEIDTALVGANVTPTDVTMTELIYGITDDEWFVNETKPYLKDLTAEHMADEIALLQSTLTMYDRAVEGVTKFYEKLPQGFRDKLEELGIGTMTAVGIIVGILAQYVDRGPGLRNFAKTLRAGTAIRQASSEGMSQTAITEGRKKWEPEYAAWMKRTAQDPNSTEPPPDLYECIQNEHMNAAAERKFNEQKGRFDAYIAAVPTPPSLFGDVGGTKVHMELTRGAAPKVVKDGAGWKAVLSESDINENTAAGTFALKAEADKLKSLFHIAVAADPNLSEVKNGAFALQEGGILSAEIDAANMTQPRLETALLSLKPGGKFKTLKFYDDASKLTDGTEQAKCTANVLEVNYTTLDHPAHCAKLKIKAAVVGPDKEWTYDNDPNVDDWVV